MQVSLSSRWLAAAAWWQLDPDHRTPVKIEAVAVPLDLRGTATPMVSYCE